MKVRSRDTLRDFAGSHKEWTLHDAAGATKQEAYVSWRKTEHNGRFRAIRVKKRAKREIGSENRHYRTLFSPPQSPLALFLFYPYTLIKNEKTAETEEGQKWRQPDGAVPKGTPAKIGEDVRFEMYPPKFKHTFLEE